MVLLKFLAEADVKTACGERRHQNSNADQVNHKALLRRHDDVFSGAEVVKVGPEGVKKLLKCEPHEPRAVASEELGVL